MLTNLNYNDSLKHYLNKLSINQKQKKMKKKRIPSIPKERKLNIQSREEREKRLKEWEKLLNRVPFCECKKSKGELLDQQGYISDNADKFEDAIFIYESEDLFASYKTAFTVLYFCFLSDGDFKLIYSSSEHYRKEDADKQPITTYLKSSSYLSSWAEGYEAMLRIVENFFSNKIPRTP